ncbi:MAG: aminotransferase class V-fold PLP-dependent enzyme [Coriobacteriales bacterium]|jgi:cysteine desulfurase family protein|nr:aminotransferase class V-fold PLP-dependent enzyme [Coriobacteriales bacterium]
MEERIAYFDNAATSFPKPEVVYRFADEFYRRYGVNVGRGQYEAASKAAALVEETRNLILSLYGCPNKQVVFTASATEALNKILLGLDMPAHPTVYVSPFEHNSVTRVLHATKSTRALDIRILPFDEITLEFDSDSAKTEFDRHRPDYVVATHASNVCGAVLPIEKIFGLSKEYHAVTVADMSQTAGLLGLDLSTTAIDYAVFAGHKSLLGPFGIGGFICSTEAQLTPVLYGGTGFDSLNQDTPTTLRERMEVGSPNIHAISGLNAALRWIGEKVIERISGSEKKNAEKLLETLRSHKNVSLVANEMTCERIGVVSARFDYYSPDEIGRLLSERNVAVRTGLHCSPYAHDFLKTSPSGTVRFSVSCLTDDKSFEDLEKALSDIEDNG